MVPLFYGLNANEAISLVGVAEKISSWLNFDLCIVDHEVKVIKQIINFIAWPPRDENFLVLYTLLEDGWILTLHFRLDQIKFILWHLNGSISRINICNLGALVKRRLDFNISIFKIIHHDCPIVGSNIIVIIKTFFPGFNLCEIEFSEGHGGYRCLV